MFVVSLTKEDRIEYKIFKRLREVAPLANINTLRQISVYMARSGYDGSIVDDMKFIYNDDKDTSTLYFTDGLEIEFNDYSGDFDFILSRKENHFSMKSFVSLDNQDDLSSLNIYSELIVKGYGMYVVSFRPKNLSDESTIKYGTINYYTNDEIDWVREIADEEINNNFDIVARKNGIYPFSEKVDFEILTQRDMVEDCYQGYVSNILKRIDLLYNNMKYLRIKRKKREKV